MVGLEQRPLGIGGLAAGDVAALLGVRRPSLNKILREFERAGVVELSYRCVDIVDRPSLVRAAGRPAD